MLEMTLKGRGKCKALHKVVKEVLIAVLVTRHGNVLLRHYVVVGVVTLPCELLALFCDSSFLFALRYMSVERVEELKCGE